MDDNERMKDFVRAWHDMCKSTQHCSKCRAKDTCPGFFGRITTEFIDMVEEWKGKRLLND